MEYVKIPYVEKEVSRIIFGTAMPPVYDGGETAMNYWMQYMHWA